MIRTTHAFKTLLISRQRSKKGEEVFDPKEPQAQQALSMVEEPSPATHPENQTQGSFGEGSPVVCWWEQGEVKSK